MQSCRRCRDTLEAFLKTPCSRPQSEGNKVKIRVSEQQERGGEEVRKCRSACMACVGGAKRNTCCQRENYSRQAEFEWGRRGAKKSFLHWLPVKYRLNFTTFFYSVYISERWRSSPCFFVFYKILFFLSYFQLFTTYTLHVSLAINLYFLIGLSIAILAF